MCSKGISWHVHPLKTQTSMHIHASWSESLMNALSSVFSGGKLRVMLDPRSILLLVVYVHLSVKSLLSYRGSYMSAYALLNLLNELRKRDKMRGLWSILFLFRKELNKFNNTRPRMLDSIYHMT